MANDDEPLVLTPREARKILRCSRSVLYSGLKNGSIPSVRISARKIIIPKRRFLEWLDGGGKTYTNKNEKEKADSHPERDASQGKEE